MTEIIKHISTSSVCVSVDKAFLKQPCIHMRCMQSIVQTGPFKRSIWQATAPFLLDAAVNMKTGKTDRTRHIHDTWPARWMSWVSHRVTNVVTWVREVSKHIKDRHRFNTMYSTIFQSL